MTTDPMTRRDIPDATVARLPGYLRALHPLVSAGVEVVSSEELATIAGVRSAGLRKDLSYLGSYGVRGVGYDVERLASEITRQLGLQHPWSVAIIGMGNLGHALAAYSGFATRGFEVQWLVDRDPAVVGTTIAGMQVVDFEQFAASVTEQVIAVISTPPVAAQEVADAVVALGVRSILNFAPGVLNVPAHTQVRKVDLATELQILAFHEQRGKDDARLGADGIEASG
ncbi:redox-sensing transcriptional repressor Rex [Allobranchiibius sp. GilTou73]|uniref:redox-sensing transcriptional repressor Rex n=1 Tax=Allobranchiibius sp. GilTou73 TaxID=2904523 RepID=UPI001F1DA192|nr:redox-sensing transcriptional repressor Rex [Allobranchiibius sp. GilTou73]UIJ34996.1 redox-sensing transcriptional repressor Rex [Allobranchiibius sp. GilTou73]